MGTFGEKYFNVGIEKSMEKEKKKKAIRLLEECLDKCTNWNDCSGNRFKQERDIKAKITSFGLPVNIGKNPVKSQLQKTK